MKFQSAKNGSNFVVKKGTFCKSGHIQWTHMLTIGSHIGALYTECWVMYSHWVHLECKKVMYISI